MPWKAHSLQFRNIADDPHDGVPTILPTRRFFPTYPSKCHCLWYKSLPAPTFACGSKSKDKHHHSWWCPCWICRAACNIQRAQRKRIAPTTAADGILLRETSACFRFVREAKGVRRNWYPLPVADAVQGFTCNAVCPRKLAHRRAGLALLSGNRWDSARVWNCQWHSSVVGELRLVRAYCIILQHWRGYLLKCAYYHVRLYEHLPWFEPPFTRTRGAHVVAIEEYIAAKNQRLQVQCPARRCDLLARAASCQIIAAWRLRRLLKRGVPWNFAYATAAECIGTSRITVLTWRTADNRPGHQWVWFPGESRVRQERIDSGLPIAGPPRIAPSSDLHGATTLTTYCPRRTLPSA